MRRWLLGAVAACGAAAPLHAQLSLRVGAVRARYAGSPPVTALQVGPRIDLTERSSRAGIEFNWARFDGGGWAVQGAFDAASSYALGRAGLLGILFTTSGNALDDGTWAGQVQGGVAFGRGLGPVVTSVGVTAGGLRSALDSTTPFVLSLRASLGAHAGPVDVALRAQRVRVSQFRYADAELGATRRVGLLTLDAAAGVRGFDDDPTVGTWRAQAAAQLVRFVALEVGGGRTPRSPEGFLEGLYVTAGLRLIAAGRVTPRPAIERTGPGQVQVHFEVSGARNVAIAGDWNAWTPAPLMRAADGRWTAVLSLGPGAHKFALVVDGKNTVPRGVPRLPDGFGGEVGLLVI